MQAAFGVSQGQIISDFYYTDFHRKGSYSYLLRVGFQDNTYSTMTEAYSDQNSLWPTNVNNVDEKQFTTILYPNPATNTDMKLMLMGNHKAMMNYTITDISGRVLINQKTNWQGNNLTLPTKNLATGTYLLNVGNKANQSLITETFQIK